MLDVPVLVVGGRTTGLMMASELARRGVPVRIIDKWPGIDPHVRANLLHSRTLEIFQGLGLAERATAGSFAELGVRLYANGQLVGAERHTPIDSPFPFGMSQSQARTEAVLEEHLNAHGVKVERRVRLVALAERGDGALATLEHPDGREEVVETPWLIGCDGAHSSTRQFAGCAFPGERDPYPYLLTDVVVEGDLEENEGYLFMHDEGDLFLFSTLPEGRRLVSASVPPEHEPSEAPTLEMMQRLVDTRGIRGLRLSDPRWLTSFRIDYRLAPHYRHGRVLLAGDAAHIHSLLAGQGMNTGIQDAFNLAWKLALVLRGVAPEWWLDTYESERRTVGEDVVAMTRTVTERVELYAGLSSTERERLISHMLVPAPERLASARHLQEVDLDYRESPLSLEPKGEFDAGPHAGAQAPDATPIVVNGQQQSLYQFFGGLNHRLLLFGEDATRAQADDPGSACRRTLEHYGDWIDVCVVVGEGDSSNWPDGTLVIRDPQGSLRARYSPDHPALYLIRPDGYIAYRSRRWNSLGDYLDRVL